MSLIGKAILKVSDAVWLQLHIYIPFFIGKEKLFETNKYKLRQNSNVDEQFRFLTDKVKISKLK